MTEAERIQAAKEKAAKLVKWFDGKPRPTCPFKLNDATTVHDIDKSLDILFERVLSAPPYRYVFMSSYQSLITYKKYFENVFKENSGLPKAV